LVDYEACLALKPDMAEAMFNSGTAYLAMGDYAKGWERYEWRLRIRGAARFVPDLDFSEPAWTGDESLAGKTLLLHSEQGLGDTLQFCRYADLAKAAGARVILQVEPPLVRVLSSLRGADLVIEKGAPPPAFDRHASLMSLPHAFGTTLESVPADIPYLHAEPAKTKAWAERLGPRTRPRVGLVWSGGFRPDQPEL
jgi:hypothetical protein